MFGQFFDWWGKKMAGKTRIALGFTPVPGREVEYGFSGFITTKKSKKP